jgi:hypothetical protein
MLACIEADLSNGHSVEQKAVAWVTAVIAGVGLAASAITSGLGHSNTAAHVAANAMSLFGYMQAQAFIGLSAVPLPPIVAAWTQNFQWSMGIIRVQFLQTMATWYQRATGGTPTTHLSQLDVYSVEVQKKFKAKRAIEFTTRAVQRLMTRSNAAATEAQAGSERLVLHGVERVGFKARIETTNIFFTGYTFFMIFIILTVIGVVAFKFICEGLTKAGKMKSDKFVDFRNGWQTILKGILFRVVLIGFPQMMVLGFWELTQRDSAGLMVLAVLTMITMIGILGWASSKVVRIAQRSIAMHKNPAYILYSDPVALNKWGFLYVQFKAAAYWFIIPWLVYLFIKAMFIGLAQNKSNVQAIALVIIEAALLVGAAVLRPWMDKKTNGFNIAIAAVNFLSAIFLLMFTEIFKQPVSSSVPWTRFTLLTTHRQLSRESWVLYSSSSTPSSRSFFSSCSWYPLGSLCSPRTPIPAISPCVMTAGLSSNRRLRLPPNWMHWAQLHVVRARGLTPTPSRGAVSTMTTTSPRRSSDNLLPRKAASPNTTNQHHRGAQCPTRTCSMGKHRTTSVTMFSSGPPTRARGNEGPGMTTDARSTRSRWARSSICTVAPLCKTRTEVITGSILRVHRPCIA